MKFRVRIDNSDDVNVLEFCSRYTSYVIVHHILPHGNPHYHMYIEDSMSLSIDAIRARSKRFFKVEKRSDYSVKTCDDDKVNEYVQYLFNTKHGNVPRLVSVHNFDHTTLDQCKENAKTVSDEYDSRSRKREKLDKGPTLFQIGQELYDMIKDVEDPTIYMYSKMCMSVLHKHHKTSEPNMMIKIISTAMSRHQPDRLVKKVQEYFKEI